MKLPLLPFVRSGIAALGFAAFAVACSARSGDLAGASSQAIVVAHYYTCAPKPGACGDGDSAVGGPSQSVCNATVGCTWTAAGNGCTPQAEWCAFQSSEAGCLAVGGDAGLQWCNWTGDVCLVAPGACPTSPDTTEPSCNAGGALCLWNSSCTQTAPCASGNLNTAEECTDNPVCQATERWIEGPG